MNIDWNELRKGLDTEIQKTGVSSLEKEAFLGAAAGSFMNAGRMALPLLLRAGRAIGPLLSRGGEAVAGGARAAAPYVASGIENTGAAVGRVGDALNSGLGAGLQGVSRAGEAIGRGVNTLNDAAINSNTIGKAVDVGLKGARAAAPYVASGIENTGAAVGRVGDKLNNLPWWIKAPAAGMAAAEVTETMAPETHKKFMDSDGWLAAPYQAADNAKDFLKGVASTGKIVKNVASTATQGGADLLEAVTPRGEPATGGSAGNTIHGNLERAANAAAAGGKQFTDFTGKVKNFFNEGKDTASKLYEAGTQGINSYFGGMGDMGKYIPALGGLLAGGLGAYLLTRKKPSQGGYGYGGGMPAININVGGGGGLQGRRMPPGFLNNDPTQVQSLGSYKEGSLLKGADIVDALSSAVGRRMADKVLNSAAGPGKPSPQHEEHPKVLEITSKHPHMTKLLKNKKNKEYLENLLKE